MNPKLIVIFSGLFLMVVGVALIVIQFYFQMTVPEAVMPARSLNLEAAGAKAHVSTTYIGLALVVAGTFLESIGFLFGRERDRDDT